MNLRELEVRAIGLIDQANETNAEKSLELIGTPHHLWGGLTVLDLAALSYGQNFVATQTCQTDIWSTWKKGFEATGIAVVFCTFVPFAISSLVTFLPRNQPKNPISFDSIDGNIVEMNLLPTESVIPVLSQHSVDSIENMKQKKRTLFVQETGRANELNSYPDIDIVDGKFQGSQSYQDEATILTMIKDFFYRMTTFYTSPVVKFTLHTVSTSPTERSLNTSDPNSKICLEVFYILFLSLYTYVALFSFRPTITTPEICLQCWIGILMLDELRAVS